MKTLVKREELNEFSLINLQQWIYSETSKYILTFRRVEGMREIVLYSASFQTNLLKTDLGIE
jgi:hypothetical protein